MALPATLHLEDETKNQMTNKTYMTRNCIAVLLSVALSFAAVVKVNAEMLDRVAAVVNDDVVMMSEVKDRLDNIYLRMRESNITPPDSAVLQRQVLERLIEERLQLNMAARAGIKISDQEVNDALARLAKSQNLTVDQIVEKAHKDGINLTDLRRDLRREMLLNQVQLSVVNRRIKVTDQELDNFLTSEEGKFWASPDVNLGHILIPIGAGASREEVETTLQKVNAIYQQIVDGADFRQMAIANSAGQFALQGGDLGWRKMAELPAQFIAAIENLEPGQLAQPIRSDAGFHLLKLYDIRGGGETIIQQNLVRHILLKPNAIRNDDDTRQLLLTLAERIRNGEDFAEMAKENSEDIGSALNGGDLGWSVPGKFVPEFDKVMNQIKVGEISAPFHSQFGWHILQVTERRNQDFSEEIKRNQAFNILRERKFEEELRIWLQEIRDEAYIEIKS